MKARLVIVSDLGRIRVRGGGATFGHDGAGGYLYAGGSVPMHRIVADAFCEKGPGASIVNHKDGNRKNNTARNLEWTTPAGNAQHARATGLCRAAKNGRAVQQLRHGLVVASYESVSAASRATGAHGPRISTVCKAGRGLTAGGYEWAYVEPAPPGAAKGALEDDDPIWAELGLGVPALNDILIADDDPIWAEYGL